MQRIITQARPEKQRLLPTELPVRPVFHPGDDLSTAIPERAVVECSEDARLPSFHQLRLANPRSSVPLCVAARSRL